MSNRAAIAAAVVLLGVHDMTAALPAEAALNRAPAKSKIEQARQHMTSALQLLDEANAPPEVGAHLQAAIDSADQYVRL